MTDISSILPLALLAAFLVGLSKGGLPAIAMLAVPLLALYIDPLTAAAYLLPIYLISDALGLWFYRKDFSKRNLAILVPAGLFGILLGYIFAPMTSVPVLNTFIGTIGVAYCLKTWLQRDQNLPPKPANIGPGIFWGTITGITSFITHSGAPPFQMYVLPQKLSKLSFAGTTVILFAIINFAKLPPYLALGQFPRYEPLPTAGLVVVSILGVIIGAKLTKIMPEQIFFIVVQVALFAISLRLIWKAIPQLFG